MHIIAGFVTRAAFKRICSFKFASYVDLKENKETIKPTIW